MCPYAVLRAVCHRGDSGYLGYSGHPRIAAMHDNVLLL